MEQTAVLSEKAPAKLDIGNTADEAHTKRNTTFPIDIIYAVFINLTQHPYGIDMRI